MRALIWPLLDHKFLRHPGIGVKLLLPIELAYYLEKEDKDFYDRARPDKLNMIKPLRWTGPSLYDLAGDRLRACAVDALDQRRRHGPRLRQFVDESVGDDSLKDALGNLRTPRQLFKFLHRLARRALPPPHRGQPPLDGRRRHLPHHLRRPPPRPRRLRPRLRPRLTGRSSPPGDAESAWELPPCPVDAGRDDRPPTPSQPGETTCLQSRGLHGQWCSRPRALPSGKRWSTEVARRGLRRGDAAGQPDPRLDGPSPRRQRLRQG